MKKLILFLVLIASPAISQDHPHFFITSARETIWAQMKTDYEANTTAPTTYGGRMYKFIKEAADLTATAGAYSEDNGEYATFMYHVTGNTTYRDKAWTRVQQFPLGRSTACTNSGISGNFSREFFVTYVWIYDWLYQGLNSTQRTQFLDRLNLIADCTNKPGTTYAMGIDSDQTTGEYMGLAMLYVSTSSYNPTVVTIWNDPVRLIGGLDSTGSDYETYRNSVYRYVTDWAAGGEWLEGYEYSNGGTIKLLLFGYDAINTWLGVDKFPEITTWKQDAAIQMFHMLSPNSTAGVVYPKSTDPAGDVQPYLWGDIQAARKWRSRQYYETAVMLAGVNVGTSSGPYIQDWVMEREENTSLSTMKPYGRGLLLLNPYATRGDWTSTATTKYVSGVQMLNARTGWGANDSWFMTHFARRASADHIPSYWGEFQLFKAGKWAITHPQCYGGPCIDSRASNGVSMEGVPVGNTYGVKEYRSIPTIRTDTSPVSYTYITGTQGGDIWGNHRYGGTASFIMEHTRSLLWLKSWDVIVAFDRVNNKNQTYPTASVATAFKTWSDSRPRHELYVHMPVSPTQASNYTDWIYDGSSAHTRVTHLLPASTTNTLENENTIYSSSYFNVGTFPSGEKKFHVKIVPTATNQYESFLNVWDVYGTASPSTVTLVQDTTNKQHGALITRDTTQVLVLFNGLQGSDIPGPVYTTGNYYDYVTTEPTTNTILSTVRLRKSSFSVTFSAGSNTTKALIFDLDPSETWNYQINGGGSTSLSVTSEGIGSINITQTGTVTLAVNSGDPTIPVEITTAGLANGQLSQSYSQPITAQYGNGGPYTCSVISGVLPTGLSMPDDTPCATGITGAPSSLGTSNSLIKVVADGWGNAGANSVQEIASGDGYVTVVAGNPGTQRAMFGLSVGSATQNYTEIDFGLHQYNNVLWVFENGVQKFTGLAFNSGDILKVGVESGVVKYRKNGTVFYTSATSPSYPLLVDAAINYNGNAINNTIIAPGGIEEPVEWENLVGVNNFGTGFPSFTVEACDSLSSCGTKIFSLTILSALAITTQSFDTGTVGIFYDDSCTSVGGTNPKTYSLINSTTLPPGLSLNSSTCAITGTPATLGTYAFNLRVTDAVSDFFDVSRQITINQAQTFELIGTKVQLEPSATSVTVHFGVPGLKFNDPCIVSLLDSDAVLDTASSTTGLSRRKVYFTGLESNHIFGIEVTCNEAQSERFFFTTLDSPSESNSNYTFALKPNPFLVSNSIDSVDIQCDDVDTGCTTNCNANNSANNTCGSGCSFTVSGLAPGRIYNCRHRWGTSTSSFLFFGKPGLFAIK